MPITNFERITHDLTDDEVRLVDPLLMILMKTGPTYPVKNEEICRRLQIGANQSARVRKLIHHIRVHRLLPKGCVVVATSNGYHCSQDPKEIQMFVQSLEERIRSIAEVVRAIKKDHNTDQISLFEEE